MRKTIAIHTPTIGYKVHTYLAREIATLCAEHDVFVTCVAELTDGWTCPCPVLSAAKIHSSEIQFPTAWEGVVTNYTILPQAARERFANMLADGTIEAHLRAQRVNGIFVQWLHESLPLLDIAERLSVPYVVRTHGTDIAAGIMEESTQRAYSEYRRARAVLAGSEYARSLLPRCGIPESQCQVAPFGLALPPRHASPGSHPERVAVLSVGRIELMKGSLFSLVGFKMAAQRDERLFMNVVGDGTLLPAYRQLVQALDLQDRVKVWGFLANDGPELAELWATSDIFLQSSVAVPTESSIETFCVGALEGMAAGLALVVSDSQALPELTAGGTCGVVVPEGDSRAIADALVELARAPTRMAELGARARQRVTEHYSPSRQRDLVVAALFGPA